MEIEIKSASMERTEDNGYLGKVQFTVKGHKAPYEIVLQSTKGRDWGYALHFFDDSGIDEEIDALDDYLNDNDDAFDQLVQAAKNAGEQVGK